MIRCGLMVALAIVMVLAAVMICARICTFQDSDMVSSSLQALEVLRQHTLFPSDWHSSTGIESQLIQKVIAHSLFSNYFLANISSALFVAFLTLAVIMTFGWLSGRMNAALIVALLYFTFFSDIQCETFLTADYYYVISVFTFLITGIWLWTRRMDAGHRLRVRRIALACFWFLLFCATAFYGMRFIQQLLLPMCGAFVWMYLWETRHKAVEWKGLIRILGIAACFGAVAVMGRGINEKIVGPLFGLTDNAAVSIVSSLAGSYDRMLENCSALVKGLLFCGGCRAEGSILSLQGLIGLARLWVTVLFALVFPLLALRDYARLPYAERFLTLVAWIGFGETLVFLIFATPCAGFIGIVVADARYLLPAFLMMNVAGALYAYQKFVAGGSALSVLGLIALSAFCIASNAIEVNSLGFKFRSAERRVGNASVGEWTRVSEFLRDSGLDYGYASYWNASVCTFVSNGRVKIRPVLLATGGVVRFDWLSAESWYSASAHRGQTFLLLTKDEVGQFAPDGYDNTVYGPVSRRLEYGQYVILVYADNIEPADAASLQSRSPAITLESGFSWAECWGRWMTGDRSVLRVRRPGGAQGESRSRIRLDLSAYEGVSSADVMCDGKHIATWQFGRGAPACPRYLTIDWNPGEESRRLEFVPHDAARPCDLHPGNGDSRKLGLGLISLMFVGENEPQEN